MRSPPPDLFPPDEPPARERRASREMPPVLTVSRLVSSARLALERGVGSVWVAGEISNCYRAGSGHVYFTLKDADAQVKCTMWRSKAQLAGFALRDGLAVEVRALPSIYEPRGEFQLNVDAVRLAGAGALYERFLALKARLESEGWFDAARKRPLPAFPRTVGVVTSPRGAAVADVITTLRRRWPALRIVVYPAAVQGEGAANDIARAIALANRRAECDVLIVCRGGGSLEDLWAFNEAAVARAIVESSLPIVSGVGHETDFTICDFVADVRAPTPTGAAQLVAPDGAAHRHRAREMARRLARAATHVLQARTQRVDLAARRLVHPAARLERQFEALALAARRLARAAAHLLQARVQRVDLATRRLVHPAARLERERDALAQSARRLARCWLHHAHARDARLAQLRLRFVRTGPEGVARRERRLEALAQNLAHLNPQAVLERGYAIVTAPDGEIVVDSAALAPGDDVRLTLAKGAADATIARRRDD